MSHPLLETDAAVVRVDRELARLDEAQVADAGRREAASASYWAAMGRHAEAAETAMLAGREPPPAPLPPLVSGDPGVFLTRRKALQARRSDVIAERAPLLLAALLAREAELLDGARQAAAVIDRLAVEAHGLAAAVRVVRVATGDPSPVYQRGITAAVLLGMIEAGARPTAPGGAVTENALARMTVS